jgi:8-oxo-dGTP pyrophosphatase MutT (NUDIX family)
MSAGVILVDRQGRVLMQLRDDDPKIMFPGHWGLTGGAAHPDETPEQAARREVEEETGVALDRFEPFRAYYFSESGTGKKSATTRTDYELYLFHAPCETLAEDMICGEGRGLRFFAPDEMREIDIAYNHRDVLSDFFASALYTRYASGAAFDDAAPADIDPVAHFTAELNAGAPWFEAMMQAIALWERPQESVGERQYQYLIGGEAFDWLLLAERLGEAAATQIPEGELERLLFDGVPPLQGEPSAGSVTATGIDDARLRELIGDTKHRAHLNYVYGVTVEEALQYAAELDIAKEAGNVAMHDPREPDAPVDPVYERIYGRPRADLIAEFRDEQRLPHGDSASLMELREFMYWLFKYRVRNQEPARVASDTRKALAQLSAMEAAVRRSPRRKAASAETPVEEITV